MLAICTWMWGDKYSPVYVERLHRGLRKYLKQPFRFLLMTEREREISLSEGIERHAIKDPELTKIKGCFARLRMFDIGWQQNRKLDERIVCLDLDVVVTGQLDDLFDRKEPLVLLGGANKFNPCPFNGSVMMFRAGAHPELWNDFSLDAVASIPRYEFPDDQGWFWHKVPDAAVWKAGLTSGIYAFRKPGWPLGNHLPSDAKLVVFPGYRDPSQFEELVWVRKYWLMKGEK